MGSHRIPPRARRGVRLAILVAVGGAVLSACIPPAPEAPPPATEVSAPAPAPDGAASIMGASTLTAAQIAAYVCRVHHCGTVWKPEITPEQMAQLYIDEGNIVGVRGDIAFCQSVLETGWFGWPNSPDQTTVPLTAAGDNTFPGYVLPRDHNYAGIGAYGGSTRYMRQPTPQLGVRAHLQHLRNYADAASRHDNLGAPLVPRPNYDDIAFDTFVFKGKAPNWVDLNGKWAVPGTTYGQTILGICNEMRTFSGLAPIPVPPPPATTAGAGITSQSTTTEDLAATTYRY